MSDNQNSFSGWAKVEIMGHQSHVGFVTTETYGQAVMFRIDRPEIPEVEEELAVSEWIGEQLCRPGSVIRRSRIEPASVLVGSASIYRMIPCDEATAIEAIRGSERRPLAVVKLAGQKQLAAGAVVAADVCGVREDDDGYGDDEAGRFGI